jgi:hypothetical protein
VVVAINLVKLYSNSKGLIKEIKMQPYSTPVVQNLTQQMMSSMAPRINCGIIYDMPVLMADGSSKMIQDLKIGDILLAYSIDNFPESTDDESFLTVWTSAELTGSQQLTTVVQHLPFQNSYHVDINKGFVRTIPEHRHLIKGYGGVWRFARARDLRVGDILLDKDGSEIPITSVGIVNELLTAFSLDVESVDTFYVNGVITHNMKMFSRLRK